MEPRSHIGADQFDALGMLDVKGRVSQLRFNHAFKIYNNSSPEYLSHQFTKVSSVHNYGTRGSRYNFHQPMIKGQAANTFYANAIKDWNNLPVSIKQISQRNVFKKAVKSYLSSTLRDH